MSTEATRQRNPIWTFAWPGSSTRDAGRRALDQLAQLYPDWHAKRFDAHFVRRIRREWIADRDVEAIAREWTRQFFYEDERQRERDVRQVMVVAETYLMLLAAAQPESHPAPSNSGAQHSTLRSG